MFGQLIHHWYLTGNDEYNDSIKKALLFQIGEQDNYMPSNQSKDLVCFDVIDAGTMSLMQLGK